MTVTEIPLGPFTCRPDGAWPNWWRVERDHSTDALSLVLVEALGDSGPHCRLNGPLGGCRLMSSDVLRTEAERLCAAADVLEEWEAAHADPSTHGRLL
jgi:hypothetical protein